MKFKIQRKRLESLDKEIVDHIFKWNLNWPRFSMERYYWIVYDEKDNWVGYASLGKYNDTSLYCGPTYIKPEYRGNGLQLKLLEIRERFAKKMEFKQLLSCTELENVISSNNLIKRKFTLIDAIDKEYKCLYWKKELKRK